MLIIGKLIIITDYM